MEIKSSLLLALWGFAVFSPVGSGAAAIDYDSMTTYLNGGGTNVTSLVIIKNISQLNSYFTETEFDTARLSKIPDFGSVAVIALLSETMGSYTHFKKTIKRVIDKADTVIVEVHSDTEYIELSPIIPQPAYRVLLISIPRTDKPIVLRDISPTIALDPTNRICKTKTSPVKSKSIFDVQGRLLLGRNGGSVISVHERGKDKIIFVGKSMDRFHSR
jgi:hypothetical protein